MLTFRISRRNYISWRFYLNCPSNHKVQKELPNVNVLPLAGGADMGTSIGAAKFASSLLGTKQ